MGREVRPARGFSIAEILLSLAMITIVVLTLLGLSMHALHTNRKNLDTAAGQLVADQTLARLTYNAESSASDPIWSANSLTVPVSTTVVNQGAIAFNVTVYANDSLTTASKRLKRIRARVVWTDQPNGRAEQGNLQVEAARLVHEP